MMFDKKLSLSLSSLLISFQVHLNQQIAQAQTPNPQTTTQTSTCPDQLPTAINDILKRPEFARMRWGILIKPLASEQSLYNQDAEKYFIPASNAKLFTTAAALNKLGANFRIRTSIYQDDNGSLRVVGRGDPSLKSEQLDILSQQLYLKGIREIDQLIADDSYFQGEVVNPSWQWEDVQFYYGAPVNSLIVNENAAVINFVPQKIGEPLKVQWSNFLDAYNWRIENASITTAENQTGSVTVYRDLKGQSLRITGNLAVNSQPNITAIAVFDPVDNFLRHFRFSLLRSGIKVKQMSVKNPGGNSSSSQEIAAVTSPPLSELLKEINGNSNNLFTEAILKNLGIQQPLKNNQTTVDAGLEVVKNTLTELGVDANSYIIVDGSGLSRKNLISPEATVKLLQVMGTSSQAEVFRASLPVAGVSGTLKNRFVNTSAQGIVQAKTGTMMGVVSLSGYVNNANYQPLVFSIMINQSDQPARVVRNAMDEIMVLLSQLKRC